MLLAVLMLAVEAAASTYAERHRHFALGQGCSPMDIEVPYMGAPERAIGLEAPRLSTMLQDALRAEGLYDDRAQAYLALRVHVRGPVYRYELAFTRLLCQREDASQCGPASAWRTSGAGLHEGDAKRVIKAITAGAHRFVSAYLRANQDACKAAAR